MVDILTTKKKVGLKMSEDKERLERMINFRATEKLYESLMNYLKVTGETISVFMRQATYDYLKLQRAIKDNGIRK